MVGGKEALAIAFGVGFCFRMFVSQVVERGVGQAEQNPPDHPKHARGVWIANAAEVLLHRDVQAVVQPALDDPVAAFELQHAFGLELVRSEAAHEVNDLVAPFAFAPDAGLQARDQTRPGEASLAGSDFDQFKHPDFGAPAVLLLDSDLGARTVLRGKNALR